MSIMSQTETKVIQQSSTQPFGFFDLKTVQWIGSVRAVDQVTKFTKEKTKSEQFPIMTWIVATIEMFIIHIYLFIHSLPWPDFMVNIIKRIDHLIEHFLEYIDNKLDWWWDVLMVRLIRLRDSIEAVIDAFLSVCLFVVYKVIEFWTKVFNLWVEFLKIIFAPVIWIFKAIFPPPEAEKKTTSAPKPVNDTYPTTSQNGANKSNNEGSTKVNELEEQNHFSPTTSDCDSDVSALSETWSIGHTDKYGKYYNRMEMKATAEGRLRAAMYKRVKAQLTIMRRNSISISKGMTSYAVEHLIPRIKPKANALIQRIKAIASKYGLDEVYNRLLREKENHYVLSLIFSSIIYVTLVPVKFLNKTFLHEKKKSRRTRSMRSESLRRRTGNTAGVVPQTGSPYGLNLSKEPVVNEETEFNNLKEMGDYLPKKEETEGMILEEKEEGNKLEDDPMRDSALASSVDDIYLLSDSNDGANSLKDQTIHEEESEEHSTPMENGKITSSEEDLRSSNRNELSSSKEDIDASKEAKLEQAPPRTKKSLKQRKPPQQPQLQHQQKQQPHSQRPQQKPPQQQHQHQQQQQQPEQQQDKKSEPCLKPVSANNGEPEPSPQTRKKSIIINKDTENSSEDQRKENNGKSPKRKISFSLT